MEHQSAEEFMGKLGRGASGDGQVASAPAAVVVVSVSPQSRAALAGRQSAEKFMGKLGQRACGSAERVTAAAAAVVVVSVSSQSRAALAGEWEG